MKRVHLFEFEDQNWFPEFLRNYGTDFLQFVSGITKMYKPILPILERALHQSGTPTIVDLGSGGGGGLVWLNEELTKEGITANITLTDFYPNIPAFEYLSSKYDNIGFYKKSVDARDVPLELNGLRTLFLAFHHFKEEDALKILQNAVDTGNSIAIFEGQERSILSIIAMLLSPITVLLATPFIRPFKLSRLLFTYIIPLVPLFTLWDGLVSALRTYSVKEMRNLVGQLQNADNYNWEIQRVKSGPGIIIYLIGHRISH